MEWLAANREWFFSGAGIFIVSTVVGFISVIATLLLQRRNERRKKKRLRLSTRTSEFRIPEPKHLGGLSPREMKVAYKGTEYSGLKYFEARMQNDGLVAIALQCLWLRFPDGTQIVEFDVETPNSMVKAEVEYPNSSSTLERVVSFSRLEPGDPCAVTALIDTNSTESIQCEPRGVDDIEYSWGESFDRADSEVLILLLAAFFAFGAIPLFGGMLQALVVLVAGPRVIRLINKVVSIKRPIGTTITVAGDVEGNINIRDQDA